MKLVYISILLSIILPINLLAQYSKVYDNYKLKYPDENLVELINEQVLNVRIKNQELIIVEDYFSEKLYLNSTAKYQSKESLVFSDFFSIDNISASSFNYISGKYKEFKVSMFREKDEFGKIAFHDDRKSINFFYAGLEPGSKTKLSYQTNIKNPRFLGAYFFGEYHPIEKTDLKIIADKNIKFEFILMNFDSIKVDYEEKHQGNRIIYHWSLKNSKVFSYDDNSVNFKYQIPHVIPIIKYYRNKDDTTFVLSSTKDLYKWYVSLIDNINKEPCSDEMSKLVDSLVADCSTDLERVKKIYYWTQKNVKYVAFEDGLGGFVPRNANDVFEKKYGDCKDNSSILEQMLKKIGIKGNLTWIGTRDIPYKYDEVHSPSVDNHMILTYFGDKKTYFLDATGRFLDINLPSSFIQGKESLIGIDKEHYKIIRVPIVDGSINYIADSMRIKLDDNYIVKGIGKRTYNGYEKTNFFNRLEKVKTSTKLLEFYKNVLEKGNNNFLLDSIYEINKYEHDLPYIVEYYYNLKNHVRKIDNKIYINLNLSQDDVNLFKNAVPYKTTKEYTHQILGEYFTELIIPKNYQVDFLPNDFENSNELCDVKINYEVKDNKVFYFHSIKTKFLTLNKVQQKELNLLMEKTQRIFKEVVVLKLKQNENE